jgi:hypothetical protein
MIFAKIDENDKNLVQPPYDSGHCSSGLPKGYRGQ